MSLQTDNPSTYPFSLAPLSFLYDALEPHIDAATMEIHHAKHHQAYITHLNLALKDYPELHGWSIEELLRRLKDVPFKIQRAVHDQGGGHFYHQLFWKMLIPDGIRTGPSGALAAAIDRDFGSFDAFKEKFIDTGVTHFASGWVLLLVNPVSWKLEVLSCLDHDSALLETKKVLLINDLWEHAYYLKYQNRRVDYLNAFWNVVDWEYVGHRLDNALASRTQLKTATKKTSDSIR